MTKQEIKIVIDELRERKSYVDFNSPTAAREIDELTAPLCGLGLSDFPKKKIVRKESIVHFLRWQCFYLDGTIHEEELQNCLYLLKEKQVIMV